MKKQTLKHLLSFVLFQLLLILALFSLSLPALAEQPSLIIDVSVDWEYSPGDSLLLPGGMYSKALSAAMWPKFSPAGVDTATDLSEEPEVANTLSLEEWSPVDFPSGPSNGGSPRYAWFRTRLPRLPLRDPYLFVYSIDTAAEFFLDGEPIYSFGEMGEGARFQGWPWHLIRLDTDYSEKLLTVRVYSDYRDIGLWGEVLLGNGAEITSRLLGRDAVRFAVAVVSVIIALIYSILFFLRPANRLSLYLSIIAFLLSLRILSNMYARQYLLDAPLVWEHLRAGTAALIYIFIIRSIRGLVRGSGSRILNAMVLAYVLLFMAGLILPLSGLVQLHSMYIAHDILYLVSIAVFIIFAVCAFKQGWTELRLLAANYLIMAALVIYSILIYNAVVPWVGSIDYLIVFVFSAGLCLIIARRFVILYRRERSHSIRLREQSRCLRKVNTDLEEMVKTRTKQLEETNFQLKMERDRLEQVSITDGLTGLYNRAYVLGRFRGMLSEARHYGKCMSIIMLDIDHFKLINDSYGHQAGDKALKIIADILEDTIRESDVVGRYGGEEFIILLPATDTEEAYAVAERIRLRTCETDFTVAVSLDARSGESCPLTLSGGLATFPGDVIPGKDRIIAFSDDRTPGADAPERRAEPPKHPGELEDLNILEQLISVADTRLYYAKESGRNRIIILSPHDRGPVDVPSDLEDPD